MLKKRIPLLLAATVLFFVACTDDTTVVTGPEAADAPLASSVAGALDPQVIPGQYIVVFKQDVASPGNLARRLADQYDLELRHTYRYAIKGFSADVPDRAVEALRSHPMVQFVEQNSYMYVDAITAPSNLQATAASETQIGLTWNDNSNNEQKFEVHRSANGPGGSFTMIKRLRRNTTSFNDTGLTADTEYCYKVRGVSFRQGVSEFSNIDCATTDGTGPPPPPEPPADPSNLTATSAGDAAIDMTWSDNSNNEDGFRVERRLGQSGSFSAVANLGANVTSHTDTGLDPATEYCYRVFAHNSVGDSNPSNIDCATTDATPPPPPPGDCPDTGNHDDVNQSGLWGIKKVKAHLNAAWQGTQNGGSCAIQAWFFGIDTGVDKDHPDLNVQETRTFLSSGTAADGHGHGTHTAGTATARDGNGVVVGVAPGAPVYGFKVCDDSGSCPTDAIIAGVDEVTARKSANPGQDMVANLSLGGGVSESLDLAIRESVNQGIVYSLSAGNGRFGICFRPADAQGSSPARVGDDDINASNGSNGDTKRVNGAITVTSSNQDDNDVNCNYGNPVTVAAPGEGILSDAPGGGTATMSGTSMAAPHVAGAALLYLQAHPGATPAQVEQGIMNDLDPWTTNDTPNADGRLDAENL